MVYLEPLPAIVNKMKANTRLIALTPPSRIHSGWMPDSPDVNNGIYVTPLKGDLKQIVSSANQTNYILQGSMKYQVDSLSLESIEKADLLARAACEATLPSILTAGLFCINFHQVNVSFDKGFGAFRSTWRLEIPAAEHITG